MRLIIYNMRKLVSNKSCTFDEPNLLLYLISHNNITLPTQQLQEVNIQYLKK